MNRNGWPINCCKPLDSAYTLTLQAPRRAQNEKPNATYMISGKPLTTVDERQAN
jgi:hypothetical protein